MFVHVPLCNVQETMVLFICVDRDLIEIQLGQEFRAEIGPGLLL